MGNCSLKGSPVNEFPKSPKTIRVLTDSGTILTFRSPKLVREVTHDFRGYGIFKRGQPSTPLDGQESLLTSQFYYLLPLLNDTDNTPHNSPEQIKETVEAGEVQLDTVGSSSSLASSAGLEVVRHNGKGVWKVKLVIGTKELEEILAEEVNVEALVERMREAAAAAAAGSKPSPKSGRKMNRFNVFDRVSSHC